MDPMRPLSRYSPDPDVPCTSDYPWEAHRPDDLPSHLSNVICQGADVVIAASLPNRTAMQIADAHNGRFTEHLTDKTSLIHE